MEFEFSFILGFRETYEGESLSRNKVRSVTEGTFVFCVKMGSPQNQGPFPVPLHIRCCNIFDYQKGPNIFGITHIPYAKLTTLGPGPHAMTLFRFAWALALQDDGEGCGVSVKAVEIRVPGFRYGV